MFKHAPNIPRLKRMRKLDHLIRALHYQDKLVDTWGRVVDYGSPVRREAVLALGEFDDPRASGALSTVALVDENESVRQAAIQVLGSRHHHGPEQPRAHESLAAGSSAEAPRATAAGLQAPQTEALAELLRLGDVGARRASARALGELYDSRAVESLLAATRDVDSEVRVQARAALDRLGSMAVIAELAAKQGEAGAPAIDAGQVQPAVASIRDALAAPEEGAGIAEHPQPTHRDVGDANGRAPEPLAGQAPESAVLLDQAPEPAPATEEAPPPVDPGRPAAGERAAVEEQPAAVEEQPAAVEEEQLGVWFAEQPAAVAEQLTVEDQPPAVEEQPTTSEEEQRGAWFAEQPAAVAEQPTVEDQPRAVEEQPTTSEEPAAAVVGDQPAAVAEEPAAVAEQPAAIEGEQPDAVEEPDKGLSMIDVQRGGSYRSRPSEPAVNVGARKAGLFAPAYEKSCSKAFLKWGRGDIQGAYEAFCNAARENPAADISSPEYFAAVAALASGAPATAIVHLERVVGHQTEWPDALMAAYAPASSDGAVTVHVDDYSETVLYGARAPAMLLAQCYAALGRRDEAIGVLQQMLADDWTSRTRLATPALTSPHAYTALLLCSLYTGEGNWDEIIHLTDGLENVGDLFLRLLLYRARALGQEGDSDVALLVYGECLRLKKDRDHGLLNEARYRRAKLNLENGRKAEARKDLDIVYAANSSYADVPVLRERAQ